MSPPATFRLVVNGTPHEVTAAPEAPLLYVLRNDLGLTGAKFGCGLGQCGACMVHVGASAERSCVTSVQAASRAPITTIEGLGTPEHPHPVQQAFIDEQAAQCAYCSNGMIMAAAALVARKPALSASDVRNALETHLCRCGAHQRIVRAVLRASGAAPQPSGGGDD